MHWAAMVLFLFAYRMENKNKNSEMQIHMLESAHASETTSKAQPLIGCQMDSEVDKK